MQERNDSRSGSSCGCRRRGNSSSGRLHDRNHPVLLIEVMKRVGGRASTVMVEGLPLDLGCGWLHSGESKPLARVAELLGYAVDRSRAAWQDQLHNLGFPVADQNEAWRAYEAFENVLRKAPPASDRAGDAIARDHCWWPYLDMLSGALNGAELDRVSACDLLTYDDMLRMRIGAFLRAMARRSPKRPLALPVRYAPR